MAGIWTDNWRAFRNVMLMGSMHDNLTTIHKTDGTTTGTRYGDNLSAVSPLGIYNLDESGSSSACTIRVGTGDRTPAASDYNLASRANVAYLSLVEAAPVYDDQAGSVSRLVTVSIQNQGANPVTIREWGIFGVIRTQVYASQSVATALLYREVLDMPVTLTQYQAATMEVTLRLTLTDPL